MGILNLTKKYLEQWSRPKLNKTSPTTRSWSTQSPPAPSASELRSFSSPRDAKSSTLSSTSLPTVLKSRLPFRPRLVKEPCQTFISMENSLEETLSSRLLTTEENLMLSLLHESVAP